MNRRSIQHSLEKAYLSLLAHQNRWYIALVLTPLIPLSWCFGFIAKKRKLQQQITCTKRRTKTPIITIGNITVGGTGKTPTILLILKHLQQKRIAYVSSGYKRAKKGLYVCFPQEPINPENTGDEAALVRQRYPQTTIAISQDKWEAIEAIDGMCDLILLDDGLQRYDIPIDLSIATVAVDHPDGYGWLLPRGILREPMSRLSTVDAIVLTYPPSQREALDLQKTLNREKSSYRSLLCHCQTRSLSRYDHRNWIHRC